MLFTKLGRSLYAGTKYYSSSLLCVNNASSLPSCLQKVPIKSGGADDNSNSDIIAKLQDLPTMINWPQNDKQHEDSTLPPKRVFHKTSPFKSDTDMMRLAWEPTNIAPSFLRHEGTTRGDASIHLLRDVFHLTEILKRKHWGFRELQQMVEQERRQLKFLWQVEHKNLSEPRLEKHAQCLAFGLDIGCEIGLICADFSPSTKVVEIMWSLSIFNLLAADLDCSFSFDPLTYPSFCSADGSILRIFFSR